MKDTYNIFARSPKAVADLKFRQENCETPGLRMKRVGDTRWMFIKGCLDTAVGEYPAFLMKLSGDQMLENGIKATTCRSEKVFEIPLDVHII